MSDRISYFQIRGFAVTVMSLFLSFSVVHPIDCQLLFIGIWIIFQTQTQEQLIIIAIAKIAPFVDPLQSGAFVDVDFMHWALSAELSMHCSIC
jgi:hypothetical protein